jgi:hypothetical protein
MSEMTFLVVTFILVATIAVVSIIGTFVTSPVLAIFALVFLLMACLVLAELRNHT